MSKMKQVPLATASADQLRRFAQSHLGMELDAKLSADKIRGEIRAAWSMDHIFVADEEKVEPKAKQPAKPISANEFYVSGRADPKITITLAATDGEGGDRPHPVGVNGTIILVPKGSPSEIPYRYYLALLDAKKTVYSQDQNTGDLIESEVPAHPFIVNKWPPQEEIDAWLAAEQQAGVKADTKAA